MGTYSSVFIKPDPVSDSYIEDITASIILLFMRTGSLSMGGGSSGFKGIFGLSVK